MAEPLISVVIPTCDRPEYLGEAIGSVLSQTRPPSEIIVIDNGREVVNTGALPSADNLRVIRALPRFGVSQARNLGAILANGDYLAFLDDDDCWSVDYLESVLITIEIHGASIVLGRLRDMRTGVPFRSKQADFSDSDELIGQIMLRNPGTVGSNIVVKRATFMESVGYDPWLTTGEDKALVLDLLLQGAFPGRAIGGWVEFRDDGDGPRQTEIRKRIEGKARFLRKYWSRMTWYQRMFNAVQLGRLRLGQWVG